MLLGSDENEASGMITIAMEHREVPLLLETVYRVHW